MKRAAVAAALVLLIAAAVGLEALRDHTYGEPQPIESALYIRSGDFLKRASLGNELLLADLYWIRAIQYYGGTRRATTASKRYDLLYPLLDIVTTLDPRFTIAYRFGSVFLAERYPGGAGRPDLAIRLLEKGLRADPSKWQYEVDIGFVHYWFLHDYQQAAAAFSRGSTIENAPWWLKSMAGVIRMRGGDRAGSRFLWQQILATADNDWLRNNAETRLAQLDALDVIDRLQALVSNYERRTGQRVTTWQPLIAAGWLRGEPQDPKGTPFVIDAATGRVTISPDSKLYPLPEVADRSAFGPAS
jgi:hypothetical protein